MCQNFCVDLDRGGGVSASVSNRSTRLRTQKARFGKSAALHSLMRSVHRQHTSSIEACLEVLGNATLHYGFKKLLFIQVVSHPQRSFTHY